MSQAKFLRVLGAGEISPGQAKVVRVEDKQIAVFRIGEDKYYAIDNRCPHEGYPLVQGTLTNASGANSDCLLTCDWHNWKFNLADGHCLRGGEDVRSYPVKIENSELHLDVSEPDAKIAIEQFLTSLRNAMAENDDSRAARDIVRLLKLGFDEKEIVAEIARFGNDHDGEDNDFHGWEHGMAVLVDCARALNFYEDYDRVIPLVQGLSAVTDSRQRQGIRNAPAPADLARYASLDDARKEFRKLVEAEEPAAAEAIFRGALAAGASAQEIKGWLFPVVTDHFLSYGHRMIYTVKAFQLLEIIGWQYAAAVLPCLVPSIVWGTREDRLPYARGFQARLAKVEPELPDLLARQHSQSNAKLDRAAFRQALLEGKIEDGFHAVDEALRRGIPLKEIAHAIVLAAAERCLRFNIAIDRDRAKEEGWLDVTHCFTHASAVREALEMWPQPEMLRGLYQAAWFVQYTRQPQREHLDLPPNQRESISDINASIDYQDLANASDEELLARLIREMDDLQYLAAMRTTRGYLELGHSASKLTTRLVKYSLADSASVPIALAHTIKTTFAAVVEFQSLGDHPHRWLPLLAAVRFLAAPKHQRWTYYGALQAIDFIANARAKEV
jgi:nitrite reductase/ring-hydroxylating ferredoxin subunit